MKSLLRVNLSALIFILLLNIFCRQQVFAQAFTNGNIVVVRIGDGITALAGGGSATATFIDEFDPAGNLVQSIPLPIAAIGANKILTISATATSEGYISRSADGAWLALAGYNATPGTTGVNGASSTITRTVALINSLGEINTTTSLTDAAVGNNFRGAVTDGTGIWVTGGAGGIRYTTVGSATSAQLSTTIVNLRGVMISDGQLYVSTGSGSTTRVATVGNGIPTSSGQTITNLPGYSATNSSPHQFFLADLSSSVPGPDVLYVADDDATGGGILKYSLSDGNWTLNNRIGAATDAYRGITGVTDGTSVTIYAVRKGGGTTTGGGELIKLTDNSGYNAANNGTIQLLATAGASQAFRGVALAPGLTALPLRLLTFTSIYISGKVVNEWLTSHEEKADYFELQRSTDGNNYSSISKSQALNKPGKYTFVDASPLAGRAYYRLKMTDLDGKFTYSSVNVLEASIINGLKLAPNPVVSYIRIDHLQVQKSGRISILNAAGTAIQNIILPKSSARSNIDLSRLPAGNYLLRAEIDGRIKMARFVKN